MWLRHPSYAALFLLPLLPCVAAESTVGGRVRFHYDAARWQVRPTTSPGARLLQLVNDEGSLAALVMPETSVAGGLSSPESRQRYFEQLAKRKIQAGDIRSIEIAGRDGFEFRGRRTVGETEYHLRVVLVVDAGDVLVVTASAVGKNPMDVDSIAAAWKAISILGKDARLAGQFDPTAVKIEKIEPADDEVREEWRRITKDADILGISAVKLHRSTWTWEVSVNVAEFIRVEPLESNLENAIATFLRTVKGVERVAREDREKWLVDGQSVKGDELVRACSVALSTIETELRRTYASARRNAPGH